MNDSRRTRGLVVFRGVGLLLLATAGFGGFWALSPLWGRFTDRASNSIGWIIPAAQSSWPVGLVILVVAGCALTWGRSRRVISVSTTVIAALLCAAAVVVPGVLGTQASATPPGKTPGDFRILALNTWFHQASQEELSTTAAEMDLDAIILAETSQLEAETVARATGLTPVLPVDTRTRGSGTALLLRPAAHPNSITDLRLTRHQNPAARISPPLNTAAPDLAKTDITVVGVHTNAPMQRDLVEGWTREMQDVRQWAAETTGPLIIAGDFNATTAHPELRRLVTNGSGTGLNDCGGGLFAAPTWPRDGVSTAPVPVPVPVLRLDHILVRELQCAASGIVNVAGSDHAGVWADLRF